MNKSVYRDEFESFDRFVVAVATAGMGGEVDPRLTWQAAAGVNEQFPTEGGFLIPPSLAIDLWERTYQTGILLAQADRQPITRGDSLRVPVIDESNRGEGSRLGGVRIYHIAQDGDEITPSKPKFASVVLELSKLAGIAYATDELLQDAAALAAILSRSFALESSFKIEFEMLRGGGISGQMLGVLNSGALVTVAPEVAQPAASILAANVTKAAARLWPSSWRSAVWLCNPDALHMIFSLALPSGSALTPLISFTDQMRLCGLPLVPHESCSSVGTIGDLVLFDPKSYLIGSRQSEFVESLHLRFLHDEACFRFTWRIAGSPGWASPVTPLFGANTPSPFVALQTRP